MNGSACALRSARSLSSYAVRVVDGDASAIAAYSAEKYESSLNRTPPTSRKTHSIGIDASYEGFRVDRAVVGSPA